jgi:hypothetical protein
MSPWIETSVREAAKAGAVARVERNVLRFI